MTFFKKNNTNLLLIILIVFATATYFHTINEIYKLNSNMFQWDEWAVVGRYIDYQEGKKSLYDFVFSQHNEHRTAVSNTLFILDTYFFGGAGIVQKLLMPALLIINALFFLSVCWSFAKKQNITLLIYSCLIVLIFVSDQHFENLFRSFNLQVISLSFFASISILLCAKIEENKNISKNYLITYFLILSNIFCTFSMSGGIFIWPFTVLLLIIFRQRASLYITLIAAIITFYLYFRGYSRGALNHAGNNTFDLLKYSIYFIGNPLRQFGSAYSIAAGIIGYSINLFLFFYITKNFKRIILQHKIVISLYFISIFIIFVSFLVGYGRLQFGLQTALSSRYLSFTDVYWASTISMLYFVYINSYFRFKKFLFSMPALLFLVGISLSQGKILPEYYGQYLSLEKAGMSLFNNVYDAATLSALYPDPHFPFALNGYLASSKLPPYGYDFVRKANEAKLLAELNKINGQWCSGYVDSITHEGGTTEFSVLSGWAFDNVNKAPLDVIVFIDKNNSVVGYGKSYINRDDVDLGKSYFQSPKLGWLGYAPSNNAKDNKDLSVYAFSSIWPSLCRLHPSR